jgi:glycerol kinase
MTPARSVLLRVDHEIDRRQIIRAVLKGVAFAFSDCLGALQVADDVHTTVGLAGMFAASPVLAAGNSRGYGEAGASRTISLA